MQGPIEYATLALTHLGQGARCTYDNARLSGRIADGELIEAALKPGENDQGVTHARVTSIDDSDTTYSRGGGGQIATGPRRVYAIEVALVGDFAVTIDDNSNAAARHCALGHSFEFRLIPELPFVAGGTVRENQRAARGPSQFFDAARDAVLRVARERKLVPTG